MPDSGARRARTASAEALHKDLTSLVDHITAEVDVCPETQPSSGPLLFFESHIPQQQLQCHLGLHPSDA